jgi:hypothetical protein
MVYEDLPSTANHYMVSLMNITETGTMGNI